MTSKHWKGVFRDILNILIPSLLKRMAEREAKKAEARK
jgi:hypothetical protein